MTATILKFQKPRKRRKARKLKREAPKVVEYTARFTHEDGNMSFVVYGVEDSSYGRSALADVFEAAARTLRGK